MKLFIIAIAIVLPIACESKPDRLTATKESGFGSGGAAQKDGSSPTSVPNSTPSSDNPAKVDGFDLNFIQNRGNLRLLNFSALVNKLRVVTGLNAESESLKTAARVSQSLGAYDHAAGVLPDTSWNLDKMATWMEVTDGACRNPALIERIGAKDGDKAFIEKAYGRDVSESDIAMLDELNAKGLTAVRRARVLCTIVLISAEFVSL